MELYELVRFLKFAVNDAKMGIIRPVRRHGQPPEGQVDDLIPEIRDSINKKTNQWFERARYLIANSQALTNPTIVELKQRLADAE